MLKEIRELGFEYVELSHGTRMGLVPGILDAVEAGEMKISSLHNFCPLPMGVNQASPNLYEFSDEREREREQAVRYTLKTIEFAMRLKASMVVTHCGSIDMKQFTDRLLALVEECGRDHLKFQRLKAEFVQKRDKKATGFTNRMKECLSKILPAAAAANVKLGIENRQAVEELPIESDYPKLFEELVSPAAAYWHDTGHAQIKENLGMLNHVEHLASLAPRLAGFHIHDVQFPGKDHCAPGTGMIDFGELKPFVKADHIKAFEFSPSLTAADARRGADFIMKLWG